MPRYGKNPAKGLEPRACVVCGTRFQPYRDYQIACSRSCRNRSKDQSPARQNHDLICKRCGTKFTVQWSGMGRQPSCEACTTEIDQTKRDRHNAARRVDGPRGEHWQQYRRKYGIQRYGLTVEQFEAMLAAQDGRCAICSDSPKPGTGPATKRLHVDHDHSTGANRGLLCNRCNRGVGYFRDDPALLRAAADYLEGHRDGPD